MYYRDKCIKKYQEKREQAIKMRGLYGAEWWRSWEKQIALYDEILNDLNKITITTHEN